MKRCVECGEEKSADDFYARRKVCKTCVKAKVLAYQRANPEKKRQWEKTRRQRNPAKETERVRNWQQGPGREKYLAMRKRLNARDREKRAAAWAEYYAKNAEVLKAKRKANYSPERKRAERTPEQSRLDRERRRARLLDAFVEDVPFDDILQRDEGYCGICGEPIMESTVELDHIVPLAAGGTHEKANVQLAHRACNRRKWRRVAA